MRTKAFLLIFIPSILGLAAPSDLRVTEGTATLSSSSPKNLTIEATDHAILHWKNFSIHAGENVQFLLPHVDAAVLNRITGSNPSVIHGHLESNGQILLLNPNGILIGPDATIHVGGLIASTLDILDTDFLKSQDLSFKAVSSNGIVNHGSIHAPGGSVVLLGCYVHHDGLIEGSAFLGAAKKILLKPEGKKHILIRTEGSPSTLKSNLLLGENPYRYAIRQEGKIDALTVAHEKGRVVLKAEDDVWLEGTIHGDTHVQGRHIVMDGSIESSQGSVELISTHQTFVGKQGKIDVAGKKYGGGGDILLSSKGSVTFEGTADIRGGTLGGDGGWIEVSGEQGLNFVGKVDRSAPFGTPGMLILDPEADLTVSQKSNYHHIFDHPNFLPVTDVVNIHINTLLAEIQKGPVTITTHFQGEGVSPGSLTLCEDIDHTYDSPYPLIFHSEGKKGMTLLGSLRNLNQGAMTFSAPYGDIWQEGQISTYGNLKLEAGGTVTLSGTPEKEALSMTQGKGHLYVTAPEGFSMRPHARMLTHQGDLLIQTAGPISLHKQTEMGNMGMGSLTFKGWQGKSISSTKLDQAKIQTSAHSGPITFESIEGDFLLNSASIDGGIGGIKLGPISGDLVILGTEKASGIHSGGSLDITTTGDLMLDASAKSTYISAYKTMRLNIGNNLLLNAQEASASLDSLQAISISAQNHMILNGTKKALASVNGNGLAISTGRSVLLFSNSLLNGKGGALFLSAGEEVSLCNPLYEQAPQILGRQVHLHSESFLTLQNDAVIRSTDGSLILTGKSGIYLDHQSQIIGEGGNIQLSAGEGNIQFYQNAKVHALTDALFFTAGKSIILQHFAKAKSEGKEGVTFVVDHMQSQPGGGLITGPSTAIESGSGPLRIFTKNRQLNSIEGNLNGYKFAAAPLYFSTKEEIWGTAYPSTFGGFPYTVFNQASGLIGGAHTQKTYTQKLINFIGPYTAEMFRDLHPYDAFTRSYIHFNNRYHPSTSSSEDELTSYEVLGETHNFIRRRHFKHHQVILPEEGAEQ